MKNFIKDKDAAVSAFIAELEDAKGNNTGGYVTCQKLSEAIKLYVSKGDMKRRVQEVAAIIVTEEIAPVIADERGYRLAPTSNHLLDAAKKEAVAMRRRLERKLNYERLAATMRLKEAIAGVVI